MTNNTNTLNTKNDTKQAIIILENYFQQLIDEELYSALKSSDVTDKAFNLIQHLFTNAQETDSLVEYCFYKEYYIRQDMDYNN